MDTLLRSQVVFRLTGPRGGEEAVDPAVAALRPALLAGYRDLDSLRYDFPVVFIDGPGCVRSLTSGVDAALRAVAPQGPAGEAMRRRGLRTEREIRRLLTAGRRGSLLALWDEAVATLAPGDGDAFATDVNRVRGALPFDGEVATCDAELPRRWVRHAWLVAQREKTRLARERISRLVIRLEEILRADRMRSPQALQKAELRSSFGSAHHKLFDFDKMSAMLSRAAPAGGLAAGRRARLEQAMATLRAQRFFAIHAGQSPHEFEFEHPQAALESFRRRLPELVTLWKALQIAELEVDGNYAADVHDALFAGLDAQSLSPQDLDFFPDYLVCLSSAEAPEHAALTEALSSGVPIKVVVQIDDLLDEAAPGHGHFPLGLRGVQLASAAMTFGEVFVLQTTASNLLQVNGTLQRGLRHPGPALFSIFGAPAGSVSRLPPYLVAAAAMQSRGFPAFSYDPAAGADLASRFSLENNPQPERDWPEEPFTYADPDLQSVTQSVAFTFVDFVACDARHRRHFAIAPRASWGEAMIPVRDWLDAPPEDPANRVPFVLAVDDADLLCRLVADDRVIRAALRCRESWHRLQEFAGIHDSRLERLLARERQSWEEKHNRDAAVATAPAPAATPMVEVGTAPPAAASQPATTAAESDRNPDEAYIETVRCSSCNECTQVNSRMFAYNENKQAYIADLKAGSYRQLVEAAESCQLSIIHPGKPWDTSEPGIAELVERAKPFL